MVSGCPGTPPQDSIGSEGPPWEDRAQWVVGRGVLEAEWGRGYPQRLEARGVKGAQNMEGHRLGSSVSTAQNVTVDEVISAYKQACQKLNCRQIPKLLRQLQVCQAGGEGG